MKKSELKAEIKEYIVEILSEDEDREPTKAELEKEKVKTVSKFKIDTGDLIG